MKIVQLLLLVVTVSAILFVPTQIPFAMTSRISFLTMDIPTTTILIFDLPTFILSSIMTILMTISFLYITTSIMLLILRLSQVTISNIIKYYVYILCLILILMPYLNTLHSDKLDVSVQDNSVQTQYIFVSDNLRNVVYEYYEKFISTYF